jgi:hypothetical protein
MSTAEVIKGPSGALKEKVALKDKDTAAGDSTKSEGGLRNYYVSKIQDLTVKKEEKQRNWERLRAQRNELNMRGMLTSEGSLFTSILTVYFSEVVA